MILIPLVQLISWFTVCTYGLATELPLSISATVKLGQVAYYMHRVPEPGEAIGEGQIAAPCTVVTMNGAFDENLLHETIDRFQQSDDVWSPAFLQNIVLQSSSGFDYVQLRDAAAALRSFKTFNIYFRSLDQGAVSEGPYFLNTGKLYPAYRLYPDNTGAFVAPTIPLRGLSCYETLDVAAYRDSYPSSLTIAVPSRLYFQQTEDKPFAGMRIGVEDAVNLCNTKASTSSHRFDDLYGSRKSDEPVIQRLVDLGFVIVGKVRTTEMADSKNPDCGDERDCGSAAAVASYPWLDFALLTDTLGSLRAPASTQGLFSMRPSLNAAGSTRLIPYTPLVNTIGGFARDAASFAKLSRALYGSRGVRKYNGKPRMILYPVEFWPKGIDKNHDLLETFIVKLEKYLGIERTPVSLEELWNATKPIKSEIALQDYMADLMKWNEGNDQRGRGSIDVDNKMMRGNEAQLRYRSDWVSTSMKETEEAGIRKWKSFKSWYDTNVLPPAKDGVSDTLLLLPWIIEKPGFQDKYQDRLQGFPGTGLFFSNPSLYAQAPEAIVPVGQIPFTSRITGQKEFLSTCIGISSGRGSDVMLSDFVENFMSGDNERRLELKFQEL